jgi:hypothetical protein
MTEKVTNWERIEASPEYEDYDLFLHDAAPIYCHIRAAFVLDREGQRVSAYLLWSDHANPDGELVGREYEVTLSVAELAELLGNTTYPHTERRA